MASTCPLLWQMGPQHVRLLSQSTSACTLRQSERGRGVQARVSDRGDGKGREGWRACCSMVRLGCGGLHYESLVLPCGVGCPHTLLPKGGWGARVRSSRLSKGGQGCL